MSIYRVEGGETYYTLPNTLEAPKYEGGFQSCERIWNPINAQFSPCAIPYIAAIPAAIAVVILLGLIFQLLPLRHVSPRWLRSFAQEPELLSQRVNSVRKRYLGWKTIALFVISLAGLGFQTWSVFCHELQLLMVYPAAAWAVACLLLVIYRPAKTPKALLTLYCSLATSQLIIIVDGTSQLKPHGIPVALSILSALGAVIVVLLMPLRHPLRDSSDISVPFSEPAFELRSPEDNLSLWQFMSVSWMAPLIKMGNKRQLNDEDVWSLGYEFKHRMLHDEFRELQGSVLSRLIQANGLDLFIISMLSIIELVANFSAPVLLQEILLSMEYHGAPRRAALNYALLSLVVRLVSSQSGVFTLWYGRRTYERSRGELITMLYEKTLSRKVVSVSSKTKAIIEVEPESIPKGRASRADQSLPERLKDIILKPYRWMRGNSKKKADKSEDLASMGKIMNLMRFDAYEVAQRFWEFSSLVSQPLSLVFAVVLIWRILGWPCLIGVTAVLFAQVINALIAKAVLYFERERRVATDTKLHKISQLVDAIRHLRYYGWQDVWLTRIMKARQNELRLRVITALWRVVISFTNEFASGLFPVMAFWAYTVLSGKSLRVDVAFPALQLFSMLESSLREVPNLITVLLNARVSIGRLEEFMNEPDKEEATFTPSTKIEMKHASFAWPGAQEPVLCDINLSFSSGLTVICGEVGAGKTALLQALLGELDQLDGEYHRTNEMVGYCGQTPWLQSMSIRENILFSAPYEEARYKQVLEACALIPDMANFKHGDLSMIGENGIGLSGGQKARVSLARAVYSRANVLLLDDPLSALDHQTAEYIVRKCLAGPLLKGRTTILVTHRTELCIGMAAQAIQMTDGRATLLDPKTIPFADLHRVKSSDSAIEDKGNEGPNQAAVPDKFIEDEYRAHGGVQASVYWEYIKAGKLKWWFVLICLLVVGRVVEIGKTWFLKQWGEAYGDPIEQVSGEPLGDLPSPENDIKPWLVGFFIVAVAQSVAYAITNGFMIVIIYKAGKDLFERVMTKVTHATFRFYDVTPVGRLMNRLTSDINTVDGNISAQFQYVALLSISWVSSVVVIGSVTPLFLIFAVALTIAFVIIFRHFLPTSQSLRRLEMVSLTPLISNFGALTDGLTTIRAFAASSRFQDRVIMVTDNFQKMDHFYWSLQAWLMYRFDTLSAGSTFMLTVLALYTDVSAGLTAFVLTAAATFVRSTHALCRQYGQLQMDFVAVERVVELLHLEQEPPGKIAPPASWPLYGSDIVFEDVTIQYAPHLDPALSNISLTIKGGCTTALIGRTGSGKSTLALALLATTLPITGRILIDGIDISTVELQALRKRVTFLAQEPVLFPGTMRQNLDPLEEYSDVECSTVLSKIASRHEWTLDAHIDTGGKNLSQGQRQLVGLARALLRRSPIVVMDEATASIDRETAMRIQRILREEMRESTVVTIAHRVEAVSAAKYCVVLAKGKVVEEGPAGEVRGLA
ncbi:ABC transporter [Drepanopeziza brunnea f. sp. 'multigermtubi' MB_m1]|uniref:ABC transporter n=1 Tax=Marssonina brunnea f. sp. multigermtubi (strain MB_m1) TaxID=1072389 RepID=K1X7V6_MARBU|nr:ABC transporter [Drepanopeziza brunnea f. sp. 'multigermtubi' MB_m1]EKD21137.1 ABC transporter [Drepanopeziza brunnea f. sp. 'multigermtubi' MB_m1]